MIVVFVRESRLRSGRLLLRNSNPCKHMGGKDGFSRGTIVLGLRRACKLLFSITTALLLSESNPDATLISSRPNYQRFYVMKTSC